MKGLKVLLIILTVSFFGLFFSDFSHSGSVDKEVEKAGPGPMVIKSRTMEVDDRLKVVTFTGDVHAKKDDFSIDCGKMLVYYESPPGGKEAEGKGTKIKMIVATEDVRLNRGKDGYATSEKAVYYQQDEKIVLTGNPVVKQGDNFVEGERIIVFLRQNRSIVEGSKDRKVKAVIFPQAQKR